MDAIDRAELALRRARDNNDEVREQARATVLGFLNGINTGLWLLRELNQVDDMLHALKKIASADDN